MAAVKIYLRGKCQEPGCTKRARHLRGTIQHRVYADSLVIKALCGEHTREWDAKKASFLENMPASNPRHMFPTDLIAADELKAEAMAAEQEAWELAKRRGNTLPSRPTWDRIEAQRARQPQVVRLN